MKAKKSFFIILFYLWAKKQNYLRITYPLGKIVWNGLRGDHIMKKRFLFLVSFFLFLLSVMELAGGQDFAAFMEDGDRAWAERGAGEDVDNRTALDLYKKALEEDPYNYEAHWKTARSLWWISDQSIPSSGDRSYHAKLGKEGMELSNRALLINPEGVEGHLYFSLCALHYAYGIGSIEAMKEGMYEEILSHLLWCYENDTEYGEGIVALALSSLYRTAPWPMRDKEKALTYAEEAHAMYPSSLRVVVFLAAAYDALGRGTEALALLSEAQEMEGDPAREPDHKRWERFIRECIKEGGIRDTEKLY
jgi:tetratricopeptide (TPR) repeat protein